MDKKMDMNIKKQMLLYAVTDRSWLKGRTLYEQVKDALDGGVTFVQLREKELEEEPFFQEACQIRELCASYQVPFVINDNVDIAIRSGADGVHVGQSDMEAGHVRAMLGPDKIIGVSCHNVQQAVNAQECGADYLGVGAMFSTGTKKDASATSLHTLREICDQVTIPVVAIGGITQENLPLLKGSGISGVAVVSAIFAQPDIREAAASLRSILENILM